MKTTTQMVLVAVLGLTAATGWGAVTQYHEPLPVGMAPVRTFLDGYVATPVGADTVAWNANTDVYGYTVQNSNMNPGWVGDVTTWVNGAALQWSGLNFAATGTQEVWLSSIFLANTDYTVSYTVSAGPDAASLTTRGTYDMAISGYNTSMYWTKIGNNWNFNATDTVVRLTLNTSGLPNYYQVYVQGVDELVLATTAVPEPASLGLLALGGLALLRRRR